MVVGKGNSRCTGDVSMLDQFQDIVNRTDLGFFESTYLNLLLAIFEDSQLGFVVQQIKYLQSEFTELCQICRSKGQRSEGQTGMHVV